MPPQMSSEKFIRAERRNRLETHKLKVTYKHYDKETVRLNYEIDREKRFITKSFRNVIKTSGASDLGIPPKNEKDTDFEKCPSYMQGLKLSNKRLMEWRECEKQLNKFITQHELERAKQKRKKYLKKKSVDYDIIPPRKLEDLDDDVFADNESTLTNEASSPCDILKDNPNDTSEVFDIKKWESEIIESYKTMVCHKPQVNGNDTKHKLKSLSSPTFSTRNNDTEVEKKKRVRPHTAQPRIRPSSGNSSIPQRPASANVRNNNQSQFLITKDSIYIKTGQSFEKLLDSRPVETPVMVNNYLTTPSSSLKPPSANMERDHSVASLSTLCPVQEGNEDDDIDDVTNDKLHGNANDTDGVSESEKEDQTDCTAAIENKMRSELSLKFQNRIRQKLERKRSAKSSINGNASNRNHYKSSNSDLSSYVEGSRRTRRDSGSASSMISMPMSRTGSFVSSHRPSISLGISADIEEIQKGQDKLMNEIKPDKPLATNKLVSVSKIVRAALTFSRVARKRALQNMQNENSSDSHEIVRQERIRKLQSRQNVLNSIASQWQMDPSTTIEQVE
ncbi:uncharacterized protein LOC132721653 isoform X2 [Ruditapes philippinarum]|nr:uncharacterized protein LOC132721653 isoform X2 [Ruditapes philippinarum]XP_060561968.1 uncharacterized protein LOC132721653 isoform X2 [Ruditapes philippinarum]XP_060561969.1 uncharacterized protein LOC132721653 isoform X2 [Ruditapes philippinarum]